MTNSNYSFFFYSFLYSLDFIQSTRECCQNVCHSIWFEWHAEKQPELCSSKDSLHAKVNWTGKSECHLPALFDSSSIHQLSIRQDLLASWYSNAGFSSKWLWSSSSDRWLSFLPLDYFNSTTVQSKLLFSMLTSYLFKTQTRSFHFTKCFLNQMHLTSDFWSRLYRTAVAFINWLLITIVLIIILIIFSIIIITNKNNSILLKSSFTLNLHLLVDLYLLSCLKSHWSIYFSCCLQHSSSSFVLKIIIIFVLNIQMVQFNSNFFVSVFPSFAFFFFIQN